MNLSRDSFIAWDKEHQARIVDTAETLEQGQADLANYRYKRQRIVDGFEVAYRALAVAALELNLASALEAYEAANRLTILLKALTGESYDLPPKPE